MTINAKVLTVLTKLFSSGWTWVAAAFLLLVGIFAFEATHPEIMVEHLNPALWVVTNLILFFGYAAILFYVALYGLVFDWINLPNGAPNVGGRLIFNLTASLGGIVGISLLLTFLAPTTGRLWYVAPEDQLFWVPTLRFLVYSWVVATIAAMDVTLIRRIIKSQPLDITVPARQVREDG
jgi:hypothetical protein